jgi:hypothetical protein
MCPRTKYYRTYRACGHTLPLNVCNHYAHHLEMCLKHLIEPVRFKVDEMEELPSVEGMCRFCREGKDIDGDFRFGETWEGSERFD